MACTYDATTGKGYRASDIHTQGTMNYQYGYVEMRAKLPMKSSEWGAFWTQSVVENNSSVVKPLDGLDASFKVEIDIYETINSKTPSSPVFNIHKWYTTDVVTNYILENWENDKIIPKRAEDAGKEFADLDSVGKQYYRSKHCHEQLHASQKVIINDLEDGYHIFGLEWTEDYYKLFVDGVMLGKYTMDQLADVNNNVFDNASKLNVDSTQSFLQPFFLIIGSGLHTTVDANDFPYETYVDWIRLYQKDGMGLYQK